MSSKGIGRNRAERRRYAHLAKRVARGTAGKGQRTAFLALQEVLIRAAVRGVA